MSAHACCSRCGRMQNRIVPQVSQPVCGVGFLTHELDFISYLQPLYTQRTFPTISQTINRESEIKQELCWIEWCCMYALCMLYLCWMYPICRWERSEMLLSVRYLYGTVAMSSAIGGMISIIPFPHEQDESCSHDYWSNRYEFTGGWLFSHSICVHHLYRYKGKPLMTDHSDES